MYLWIKINYKAIFIQIILSVVWWMEIILVCSVLLQFDKACE